MVTSESVSAPTSATTIQCLAKREPPYGAGCGVSGQSTMSRRETRKGAWRTTPDTHIGLNALPRARGY